jgi:rhodanese-related sulfurtransferase
VIAPLDLARRLAGDRPPILVDVRAPEEYESNRLPGSRHLPLGALAGRLHELDPEEEIVTERSAGIRSHEAALLLGARGFTSVAMLDGGLYAWPSDLESM